MDSNTILVLVVDGGLILFFIYALYVVNQNPSYSKQKAPTEVKSETLFALSQLEPDLSSIPRPELKPIPDLSSFLEPEPIPDLSSFLEPEPIPEPEPIKELEPQPEALPPRYIRIRDIERIGYVYSEKLKEAGIFYLHELLDAGASREGRENLAEMIGVSQNLLLEWVNLAALYARSNHPLVEEPDYPEHNNMRTHSYP